MFAVQEYLRSGKSLQDLENEFFIKCNLCPRLGVVSLNYNQIYSDLSLKISQECRGLILELNTWDIASRSFEKFFNYSETRANPVKEVFDWDSVRALTKMDGSLIEFYYYKDQWNVSTRGIADANTPVYGYDTTFQALILSTMKEMGFTFDELDPDIWYTFELTTPINRIVVAYDDYNLTWLAAWDKKTNKELDIYSLPDITAPKVRLFPMTDVESLIVELEKLPPSESEGVVLVDKNFNRLKIKSQCYIEAFHVVTSAEASPRNKLEVVLSDKFDDVCGLLPTSLRDELLNVQEVWQRLIAATLHTYNLHKHIDNQKDFALAVKDYKYKPWLFNLRKGMSIEEVMSYSFLDTKIELLNAFNGEKLL